ncbi:hypothetical protein [Bradyrhizobium sp. F1.13.3]|uniref:hypothetical protein n=1 Tax=Bradyrhizobium sp. F1.13.3 TaxID=3156351 RepID=UPI0033910889
MLTLYYLFHQFAGPEFECKQWPALFEKYKADFDTPTVESFVAHLIAGYRVDWTLAQLEELHKTYFKTRHTASVTKIGLLLEAALSLYVAEVNRAAGNDPRARALIAFVTQAMRPCGPTKPFCQPNSPKSIGKAFFFPRSRTTKALPQILPPPSATSPPEETSSNDD